jgi:hypothetical protein
MILGANTIGSVEIAGAIDIASGVIPGPPPPVSSFHNALATQLYPAMINRERLLMFGDGAELQIYSFSGNAGEIQIKMLETDWSARRIPTIESGSIEDWRVEIVDREISWATIKSISTVRIWNSLTNELNHLKVIQTENAMKPGHVYLLRCEAIDQT